MDHIELERRERAANLRGKRDRKGIIAHQESMGGRQPEYVVVLVGMPTEGGSKYEYLMPPPGQLIAQRAYRHAHPIDDGLVTFREYADSHISITGLPRDRCFP